MKQTDPGALVARLFADDTAEPETASRTIAAGRQFRELADKIASGEDLLVNLLCLDGAVVPPTREIFTASDGRGQADLVNWLVSRGLLTDDMALALARVLPGLAQHFPAVTRDGIKRLFAARGVAETGWCRMTLALLDCNFTALCLAGGKLPPVAQPLERIRQRIRREIVTVQLESGLVSRLARQAVLDGVFARTTLVPAEVWACLAAWLDDGTLADLRAHASARFTRELDAGCSAQSGKDMHPADLVAPVERLVAELARSAAADTDREAVAICAALEQAGLLARFLQQTGVADLVCLAAATGPATRATILAALDPDLAQAVRALFDGSLIANFYFDAARGRRCWAARSREARLLLYRAGRTDSGHIRS